MEDFKCEICRTKFFGRKNKCPVCGGHIVPEKFCRAYRYGV